MSRQALELEDRSQRRIDRFHVTSPRQYWWRPRWWTEEVLCSKKSFIAADSTRTKTIYCLLYFFYWPTFEEKESILNLNVFGVLGYSFKRLKPSRPSILPGDGSSTPPPPPPKKKRGRRGDSTLRMKKCESQESTGYRKREVLTLPLHPPPPPPTYPLHNISTFQTRRAFNSC